jgi:hypothetical protein
MMGLSNRTTLHDDDRMPIGAFKGKRIGDVPVWWWKWFARQHWCDQYPDLVAYANLVEDEDAPECRWCGEQHRGGPEQCGE